MWRDGEADGAAGAATARISPALLAFARNPFRLLRIPLSATTVEAGFAAERMLTLARAEMSSGEPDPLPWLPAAGFPELQEAAQTVEEPLLRLKHQLLWFASAADPRGHDLAAALQLRDGPALADYLARDEPLPDGGPGWLGGIANAINQANARLLLAAAKIDGLWPGQAESRAAVRPIDQNKWRPLGDLRSLHQAHLAVRDPSHGDSDEVRALWQGGLSRWTAVMENLASRWLVVAYIQALDDDFAHEDDAEAIEESILTHLADLSAQQIRFLLVEGRYSEAGALVAAVAESGLEPRLTAPAMRPVRQLLQTELAALDPLLEQERDDPYEPIALYLRRLAVIRERWRLLDAGGVLGLGEVVDRAVERVYRRLRQSNQPGEGSDALLEQAGAVAFAQSLRERIGALRTQQQVRRDYVCEFCGTRDPDQAKAVILKGKREGDRTETTIYIESKVIDVFRCGRCADLHAFLQRMATAFATVSVTGLLVLLFLWIGSPGTPGKGIRTPVPYSSGYSADYDRYRPSNGLNAAAPSAPAEPVPRNSLAMRMPSAGSSAVLTVRELRYCLAETIRVQASIRELNRILYSEPGRHGRNVAGVRAAMADYDARCDRDYITSNRPTAEAPVLAQRSILEAEGRARVR